MSLKGLLSFAALCVFAVRANGAPHNKANKSNKSESKWTSRTRNHRNESRQGWKIRGSSQFAGEHQMVLEARQNHLIGNIKASHLKTARLGQKADLNEKKLSEFDDSLSVLEKLLAKRAVVERELRSRYVLAINSKLGIKESACVECVDITSRDGVYVLTLGNGMTETKTSLWSEKLILRHGVTVDTLKMADFRLKENWDKNIDALQDYYL